jgi:hypothetical protein
MLFNHPPTLSLLIATLTFILVGCGGDRVVLAPEFAGTFVAHGKAAIGAEVLIGFSGDHDHPCEGLPVAATVDAAGRFNAPARTSRMTEQEREAIPYGTFQNYVCFRYKGELLVSSMFITNPDETDKYIGACVTPHTSTGYDDHMCRWRREHA